MRICPKCNFQNEDSALICSACSSTLPVLPAALTDVDAFMDRVRIGPRHARVRSVEEIPCHPGLPEAFEIAF